MGKIKGLITEEMENYNLTYEEAVERVSLKDYVGNRYTIQDSYQFPTGYHNYNYGEVIWEDDPDLWEDTIPETSVECSKSPTHHHEWTGSGNPKGMEWCKHCDVDKPEGVK